MRHWRSCPETLQSDCLTFVSMIKRNLFLKKKKTHEDKVRFLHDPFGRRSANSSSVFRFAEKISRFYVLQILCVRAIVKDLRLATAYRLRPPRKGASRNRFNPSPRTDHTAVSSLYNYIDHTCFSPFFAVRFTHRHKNRLSTAWR